MTAPSRKQVAPLDGVTLDQIRVLVSVADEGGFSAAARRLGRVQSAVSQSMASLEVMVGYKIWDRSERTISLTERGRVLLVAGRAVLGEVERMRETSEALRTGKTERLTLCVDAIFPARGLVSLASSLRAAFPGIALRLDTDTLASVGARVSRREADVGIAGPVGTFDALERVAVGSVLLVPVASRGHRLAGLAGRITTEVIRSETQIVLSERGAGESPDQAVISEAIWRVADLSTKREFILGGLGWGNLPEPLIQDDLRRGDLVRLQLEAWNDEEHRLPLALVYPSTLRKRATLIWLVENVPVLCAAWGVGERVT